jgi:hypothetical protein
MSSPDTLMNTARFVVRFAWFANRFVLVAIVALVLGSFIFDAGFTDVVRQSLPGADIVSAKTGMRLLALLGIVMAVVTDRLLGTLSAIVGTAAAGEPFVAINAQRLQFIGWGLLALQLCDIPGGLIARYFPAMGSAAPEVDISFAGWIAVLMAFVLARIFAVGSAMRDELEGTV